MSKYKQYPKYKDSGVEWLGEIPKPWNVINLKYAIDVMQTGTTPSTSELEYYNGKVNWFNPTDLNSQILISSAKQVTHKSILEGACRIFPSDSILIVGIGATAGKTSYLAGVDSSFNQQITGFHSKINYNKYLFYLMKSFTDTLLATANFTTLAILNNEFFKSFAIVVAPIQEQQTIANYLDKATVKIDTLIEKQTKLIELLKEKRQAVISTAVTHGLDSSVPMKDSGVEWLGEIPEGWEVWKMSHAFNTIGSGTTPSSTNESYYNGSIPWVTTGELRENIITKTKKLLTNKAISDNSSLKLFPVGSVIIAMYGATIGRLGVLGIQATTNQACCVITNSSSITNEYLYYWLMGYRNEIIELGYGGGQPNISQDTISNLKISSPNLSEQESIVEYLDDKTSKIDNLITKATKAIDLLKERRTALISAVVTGKIDVRGDAA